MREPVWWEEARRLTRRVVEVADEVVVDEPERWLAAQFDRRSIDVVTTRFASGEEAAGLDPAATLDPEGPVWTNRLGDADGATIGLDAEGAVATVRAHSRRGDQHTVGVGRRDPDGTEILVVVRHPGAHDVSARAVLDDGVVVVVRAEWERGDTDEPPEPEVHLVVVTPAGRGRLRIERARVYVQRREPDRPAVAVLAADAVRLGIDGEPRERRVDRMARGDIAGGQPPAEVEVVGACAPDPSSLLEHGLRALVEPGAPASASVPLWSRRLHGGWASHDPAPGDTEEAASAMRDLIVAAVTGIDPAEPCALVMGWWTGDTRRSPPLPDLTVLDGAWRDRWRRLPSQWESISRTRDAVEQGEGRAIDLAAVAPDRIGAHDPGHHRRPAGPRPREQRGRLATLPRGLRWAPRRRREPDG
ncbi:hypothetical protein AB0L40_04245 [Patulibacter sp. NPDC049589]|uniref:hypothetical protein n=1 Tax=Patulibacter sp. NPDC049589 TaxID=3154731 RepID=UPI00341C2550